MRSYWLLLWILPIISVQSFGYDFTGIVRLPICSASLIRFDGSKDTDPSLVMTNGHCTSQTAPGAFLYHVALTKRPISIEFLNATGGHAGWTVSREIVYSTMTETDLALYRLDMSYAQIASSFGAVPLTLSRQAPKVGDAVEILSGYFHSGYSCAIEAFIPFLKESRWTDTDSMRYSRPGCDVIEGTSGSPLLLKNTRTVVGINSTKNEKGEICTWNNPCEVDANGKISAVLGYAYAQQTDLIYSCLNGNAELDLSVPGCLLPH
jgi:V8-like Glu-specific endopeptidase